MSFKTHYLALSVAERDQLASDAGTTRGTLNQVVYAGKQIELGLADCLVALCPGLTLDDMPLTERSKQQHAVRSGPNKPATPPTPRADPSGEHKASDVVNRKELVALIEAGVLKDERQHTRRAEDRVLRAGKGVAHG